MCKLCGITMVEIHLSEHVSISHFVCTKKELHNPTLKDLSIVSHKNEKYMGRLFIKEMHMSFHEYCLLLKLQKAEALLFGTKDKIIDIALACGFDNISYFNRTFKKQYGMSPSEYIISKREK